MPADDGKKGWVATANQRITAPNYPHYLGQDWNTPHRFDRIEQVLKAKPKHSFKDMQALQSDTVSLSTLSLLPVLRATPSNHPLAAKDRDFAKSALIEDKGIYKVSPTTPRSCRIAMSARRSRAGVAMGKTIIN